MLLWASKPLTREQVAGAPAFAFTEALLKLTAKHRTEMLILDIRWPSHLLSNEDSGEGIDKSSLTSEGHRSLE